MTDFSSVSIPQPKDWQAFERHSRLLFECSLGDPHTQNNGRSGQPQHGVDIFGRRASTGDMVGIQCKGKDVDYGGEVTNAELRREVTKTEKFQPSIKEFILITTSPDDANIQQSARLLEQEVQAKGRDLKIAVWGWGRLQQEIVRFPAAIKAFHPDASPFTDLIVEKNEQIYELVKRQTDDSRRSEERILAVLDARLSQSQIPTVDAGPVEASLDKHIHDQINTYRDMINEGKPKTAIKLLTTLRDQLRSGASNRVRYRILANIAVAHHRLGEQELAAKLFLEAADLNPQEPVSIANRAAAYLIQGRKEEAHALVVDATSRYPNDPDIALQRLQALEPGETFVAVWSSLPDAVREKAALVVYRIVALREQRDAQWEILLRDALHAYPDNRQLRAIRAEMVVDRILSVDRSALGAQIAQPSSPAELREAAREFEYLWNYSIERELPPDLFAAHNGALAYRILGELDAAAKLLDEALSRGSKHDEIKRLRISIFLQRGQITEATKLADCLSDSPQNNIYRADLRAKSDPAGARALLARRSEYTDSRHIVAAAEIYIDTLLAEGQFDEAIVEAERFQTLLPDDPLPALALYRIHSAQGHQNAAVFLDEAVQRVHEGTDFVVRFLVSQVLGEAQRFDDVVDLLYGRVSLARDAPAIREIVAAAANADRRTILSEILSALPEEVRNLPFYRRARVALAIRRGEIGAAEDEIRAFLQVSPRSLEMQLQLLQVLARQGKLQELRNEVAKPASEFDGRPDDTISLAQFKDAYGDWREAHDIAYRTWLFNQNDVAVNMRYVALFLRPGHSSELEIAPSIVSENMAVCLLGDDGTRDVLMIEPDAGLRPTAKYLAPTHPTAELIMNKALGAEIVFEDGTKANIESIKPKQLYVLHEIMGSFQKLFPQTEGLERVQVYPDKPGGFQPVFDRVRQRQEAIDQAFGRYSAGVLPIALLARSLGRETVETFIGLIEAHRPILVCDGNEQERKAAITAITTNATRGCVLDGLTLHIVQSLGLGHAVKAVCGPIGIVDQTRLRIQEEIQEIEQTLDKSDMSLIWRNGQIFRTEISPDEKSATLEALRRQKQWMDAEVEVVPAQGVRDPSPDIRRLIHRFGSAFADELFAAQGTDRLFITEDRILRAVAESEFGLRTSWLQPVLMKAVDAQQLSKDEYAAAILHFTKSGFEFVSLQSWVLVWTLHDTQDISLPLDFLLIARRLGGAKADLASHIRVALETIRATWTKRNFVPILRQAIVGNLLENLTKERPISHTGIIMRAFSDFGIHVLHDRNFIDFPLLGFKPPSSDGDWLEP
jgi:tetratricopeptide (TPR) repeat protein